jgi:two-component sensor histidine kinase
MVVKDSGVGLPEGLDIQQSKTLGLTIVKALTQQINGAIDLSSHDGSLISITFPVP